jgi:hypothetical protein
MRLCCSSLVFLMIAMAGAASGGESSRKLTADVRLFMELDSNDDDRVSEREYVGEKGGRSRARARKVFRRMDNNDNGWLSYKEYSRHEGDLWPEH